MGFTVKEEKNHKKDLLSQVLFMVPEAGVEPARYLYHRILSPARLPIPSFRRKGYYIKSRL